MQPMETAPRDGTPVRLFPVRWDSGIVCRWAYHHGTGVTGWVSDLGLAVYEWQGWEPLQRAPLSAARRDE